MTYSFGPPLNFLGLPPEESNPETSQVLLLPVPYEATTSYGGGTRNGPQAILAASTQVELYDREFGGEMARRWGIHTLPPLAPEGAGPEAMVAVICEAVMDYGSRGQTPRHSGRRTHGQRRRRPCPLTLARRLRHRAA